jgi:hypothetical protein
MGYVYSFKIGLVLPQDPKHEANIMVELKYMPKSRYMIIALISMISMFSFTIYGAFHVSNPSINIACILCGTGFGIILGRSLVLHAAIMSHSHGKKVTYAYEPDEKSIVGSHSSKWRRSISNINEINNMIYELVSARLDEIESNSSPGACCDTLRKRQNVKYVSWEILENE